MSIKLTDKKLILLLLCVAAFVTIGIYCKNIIPAAELNDRSLSTLTSSPERSSCSSKQHIMYLKTHKCASSSLQNMFFRYGILRNLTFALPLEENYLGNPKHFKKEYIHQDMLPPNGKVDIFAVHTRLNPAEHKKVLYEDAIFITAVRDPVDLFESLYNYFKFPRLFHTTLDQFVNLTLHEQFALREKHPRMGPNMMLFDMGFSVSEFMPVARLERAVEEMDALFDLVLIAERMDESLILLKEKLCWSYNDIVFLNKNKRRDHFKQKLSSHTKEKLRVLNRADYYLYNHFLRKHEMAVAEYGVIKMAEDVTILRTLRDTITEECGIQTMRGKNPRKRIFVEYSVFVDAFVIEDTSNLNCLLLSLPELRLIDMARKRQLELLKKSSNPKRF